MGVLQQIWLYEIIGGMLLMCLNTTMRVYGAWIKTYYVLSKTYTMCHNQALVRDKPLGAPVSVRMIYLYPHNLQGCLTESDWPISDLNKRGELIKAELHIYSSDKGSGWLR